MTPFSTWCLFVGIFLLVIVVARVRDWPPFTITKRVTPKDVRLSPELLEAYRQELYRHRPEIVHAAMKRPVKASPQRGNRT